ncbi:hypothetical protein J6524_24010 [Bradyrhizobium sp. WSM 1738]|uniref:hypothetical protein n=1 Tax=Bradyrhizobium hereditatis TaxID=2821405 RepID=UPI001CE2B2FB|nr:hypothetical protein [Bradyrhizobium hereditatis]MCA6117917.1 hypothetical protein [Bradyrhizobium hereditatis]
MSDCLLLAGQAAMAAEMLRQRRVNKINWLTSVFYLAVVNLKRRVTAIENGFEMNRLA